jgi:hypothetical protein
MQTERVMQQFAPIPFFVLQGDVRRRVWFDRPRPRRLLLAAIETAYLPRKTMRTLFEDTDLKADLEDQRSRGKESKGLLVGLWFFALLFLGGTWGVYQWFLKQPAPTPPPPPVSLEDPKQTTETLGKFIRLTKEGNWVEAEAMLSVAAKQRLAAGQLSLHDSLLGPNKALKIVEGLTTSSVNRDEPGKLRQDCNFILVEPNDPTMAKSVQQIIPLTLVIDEGRLAIDDWTEVKDDPKKTPAPK